MFSDEEDEEEMESAEGHDKKLEELWSRKQRRRSSDLKIFQGDRLKLQDNPKIVILLTKNAERSILFSDTVVKINKKGKMQERILMVTDGSFYTMEPTSFKVRRRISLANISHISTSLLSDNFILVHIPSEYDCVYVSGRKTEVVSILRLAYQEATGEELTLVMQNVIDYRLDKDQHRRIAFQKGDDGVYTKIYSAKRIR